MSTTISTNNAFGLFFCLDDILVYESGDMHINSDELEDAQWFNLKKLPALLPSKSSISRQLIDSVL